MISKNIFNCYFFQWNGRDVMVLGFTTTCTINAYHH